MYDIKKLEADEAAFAEADKRWNAPRFIMLGIITLLISVGLIYYGSWRSFGCDIEIVH